MSDPVENLRIWDQVQATDPVYTKSFHRGGGFSGTSINATYNVRKATQVFGPMGIGWGVEIAQEDFLDGGVIGDFNGEPVKSVIHRVLVKLWYLLDGKRGEVQHFGQTTFIGKNKHGIFTDEEASKKSLTDGTTKCLSMLGFGADIFMGLYDDVNYVEDVRASIEDQKADESVEEMERQKVQYRDWREKTLRLLSTAQTMNELEILFKTTIRKMAKKDENEDIRAATEIKDKRKAELEPPQVVAQ